MKRNSVWVVEFFGADGKWHPKATYLYPDDIPDSLINSDGHRLRRYYAESAANDR